MTKILVVTIAIPPTLGPILMLLEEVEDPPINRPRFTGLFLNIFSAVIYIFFNDFFKYFLAIYFTKYFLKI